MSKVICPICGKSYSVIRRSHLKSHGYDSREDFLIDYPDQEFVSQELKSKVSNQFVEFYSDPVHRQRCSEIRSAQWKDESHRAKVVSNRWNSESRLKQSKVFSDMNHTKLSDPEYYAKTCELLSKTLNGKNVINYTNSKGEILVLKSSWELQVVNYLDTNNLDYEWEPFWIQYTLESKSRRYLPDIYFRSHNLIVEVKPKFRLSDPTTIAKMQSCISKGYEYKFLTEDDLSDLDKYFTDLNISKKFND